MDTYEKAKKIAAGYVAARMYTCCEIEDRLCRKGVEKETAERLISELVSAGILDDRLYAKMYVGQAVSLGGKGVYRIKQELYKKGVARCIIDEACEGIEEDTFAAICEYVESRRLYEGINSRRELEKLKARLSRRGFSPSEIRECLSKYEFKFSD